jgi:hypothetical protein
MGGMEPAHSTAMLLKVDAAQLEFRVKAFLAQDEKAVEEIWRMEDGTYDIHTDNQTRFVLPDRTIAKNWLYQAIFSDAFGPEGLVGAAGGFSAKADFQHVFQGSKKEKVRQWHEVLKKFFGKYEGIYQHGVTLITEATSTGRIVVPSGRFFPFAPEPTWGGGIDWPRTKILNYPVQGFSADLVQVARLAVSDQWDTSTGLLINTVHDDVEADVDNDPQRVYTNSILLENAFKDIPKNFKKRYHSEINIPLSGEVKYGVNLNEKYMKKFKRETFFQDYKEYIEKYGQVHH